MQPAAVLNILVDAQTGKAATQLRDIDRRMKGTAASGKKLEEVETRLNKVLKKHAEVTSEANRAQMRLNQAEGALLMAGKKREQDARQRVQTRQRELDQARKSQVALRQEREELERQSRALKEAIRDRERASATKTTLAFDFDSSQLDAYNQALEKVDRQRIRRATAREVLGADFDNKAFAAYNRQAERAFDSTEKLTAATRKLGRSSSNASGPLKRLGVSLGTRIPVVGIAGAGAAIQAVVPPVVALTSALAPLTGLLAALPGLASAAAQGIGTIALGTKGVGDAVKAALDAQKTATQDAAATMQSNRAAAENVRSAVQAVGDAERSLADAQRDAGRAQEDLSAARRDAARDLIDMRLAVTGAVLSEKEARLELTRALDAQADVWADEQATAVDAREAELAVQRARLGLREATVDSKRAQDDYNDAQRKGIKGSDQVVSAQRSLQDAQRGVADAQRGLIEATRQVRIAQRDQAEGAVTASAGVDKLKEAMEALPPAGRNFARFIIGLKPQLDSLRAAAAAGIFPDLTQGIKAATRNFDVFHDVIAGTSAAIGRLGEAAGRRLGSAEWGRDIQVQGERNIVTINRLGDATLSLADGFRHITLAAGPLVSFLTASAERFSAIFASWAQGARESGRLDAFFQRTIQTTKIVVAAFWDFGQALLNIGRVADRVWGQDLLKGIGSVAERFREWTESVRGQRQIEGYFERWRNRWAAIAEAVGHVIDKYFELRRAGKTVAGAFIGTFADALARALPEIGSQLAAAAPQMAWSFIRGFMAADVWGKLAIGAIVISKLGGRAAWLAIGRSLGGALGLGISTGVASGVAAGTAGGAAAGAGGAAAAGGLLGKLGSKLKSAAKGGAFLAVGAVIADEVIKGFQKKTGGSSPALQDLADQMKEGGLTGAANSLAGLGPLPDQLSESEKAASSLLPKLEAISKGARGISAERAGQLRDELAKVQGIAGSTRAALSSMIDAAASKGGKIDDIRDSFRLFRRDAVKSVENMREHTARNFGAISELMGLHTKKGRDAVRENFRAGVGWIRTYMSDGQGLTRKGGQEIARLLRVHSRAGKDAVRSQFSQTVDAIRESMSRGGELTRRGIKVIRGLMIEELKLYGFSPKQATIAMRGRDPNTGQLNFDKRDVGRRQFARGGPINMGRASGDSVPAMLERGEYVLNRRAVAAVGKQTLDRVNFEAAPRFQTGGWVGDSPAGLNPAVKSIAAWAINKYPGAQASDTVAPRAGSSFHPSGGAVDLVSSNMLAMARGIDRNFRTRLEELIYTPLGYSVSSGQKVPPYAQADHYDHVHIAALGKAVKGLAAATVKAAKLKRLEITGRDSPLKGMVQGAVDVVRGVAQRRLNQAAAAAGATGVEGSEPGAGVPPLSGSGDVEKTFAEVAKKLSYNKVSTLALGMAGYAESGMQDLSYGHSTSQGALQLLESTAQGLGVSPHDEKAIASLFLTRGFYSQGANESARQGLPAHMAAQLAQGSAFADGSNYLAQESRARAWMRRYGLRKGGMVGYAGDSLGVGTLGSGGLRNKLGKIGLFGQAQGSKQPSWGAGVLRRALKAHPRIGAGVFDLGTNGPASDLSGALGQVTNMLDKKPLVMPSIVGAADDAAAKNRMIRNKADKVVPWADVAGPYLGDGIHPNASGYGRRASMIANAVKSLDLTKKKTRPGERDEQGIGKLRPFGGDIARVVNKTIQVLKKRGPAKVRSKRLKQFEARARKLGLPKKIADQLALLSTGVDIAGTNADNAQRLNIDNEDGTTTMMPFQGKNEGGWLNEQLNFMLAYRNKLVDTIKILENRRKKVTDLVEALQRRLKVVARTIKRSENTRDRLAKALKELNKKPKQNRDRIRELRDRIAGIDKGLKPLRRERKGLEDRIIPALTGQGRQLSEALRGPDGTLEKMTELQGPNGPMTKIVGIPTLGSLGGTILDVQLDLKNVGTYGVATRGLDSPVTDSASAEQLRELLRQANLRTAVSEQALRTFSEFQQNTVPFLGGFAKGGLALVGEQGPELAHVPNGTRFYSRPDTERMLGDSQPVVWINGDVVNVPRGKQPVEVITDPHDPRFKRAVGNARVGHRMLPGASGGLRRG
jgi:hypothetical protein